MFTKTTARREQVKLMVGLTGPSGAGKTLSALRMAYGITGDWKKIAFADTENKSALYYAGERTGDWFHIDLNPQKLEGGYNPNNWIRLIDFVEKDQAVEVLILDSISHEWEGVGGCLDIVDRIGKGFAGWKTVTPLHNKFIDKMRTSRLHIIATMRSKQDYVVEQNDKGKAAPKKVGTKATQREGTDYEFGIIFDVEMNHYATASKDRTGLFAERGPFQITENTGKELLAWSKDGAVIAAEEKNTNAKPETKVDTEDKKPGTFNTEDPAHSDWLEARIVALKLQDKAGEIEKSVNGKTKEEVLKILDKYAKGSKSV